MDLNVYLIVLNAHLNMVLLLVHKQILIRILLLAQKNKKILICHLFIVGIFPHLIDR